MLASLLTAAFVARGQPRRRYILPDGTITTDLEIVRAFLNNPRTEKERKRLTTPPESTIVDLTTAPTMGLKTIDRFIEEAEGANLSSDSEALLAILLIMD